MNEIERFTRQNPRTCLEVTEDQIAEYVSHHSGGLLVLDRFVGGDDDPRMIKMHDSWGDEESVVVHVYNPEVAEDPDETVTHFASGAAAFAYFEAFPDGEVPPPPSVERKGVTMTAGEMIAALSRFPLDKPLLVWDEQRQWYANVRLVEFDPEDIAITVGAADDYDTRQW